MRRIAQLGIVIGFLSSGLVGRPALAETRVALVIGNGAYQQAPALLNPANDAQGIAAALRRLGFRVEAGIDLDMTAMRKALDDFAELLDGADVGLLYYAGHALQVEGRNYLLPVDAKPERKFDLVFQTIDLGVVLRLLEDKPRTSLVFLDACRNNPLARDLARSLGRERSQVVGQGLASVESGVGTLISYATQPDNVALDGKGEHSPFTEALLANIEIPGVEVRKMLTRVRKAVIEQTATQQVLWDHSSLTGDFYFRPLDHPEPLPPPPSVDSSVVVWTVVQYSRNPADFELFLRYYPNSPFAPFARQRLSELVGESLPGARRPTPSPEVLEALNGVRKNPLNPAVQDVPATAERLPKAASTDLAAYPAPALGQTARELTTVDRARAAELALRLTPSNWQEVQRALNTLGYRAGPEDGLPSPRTRTALKAWQQANGSEPSGYLMGLQQMRLLEAMALTKLQKDSPDLGEPPQAASRDAPHDPTAAAARALDLRSQDPADFETFLQTYPDSPFAPFARARLVELGVPLTAPTGVQEAAPLETTAAEARFAPEIGTLPGAEEGATAPPPVEKSEQLAALPGPAPIETAPLPRPILIPAPIDPAVGRSAPEPTAADRARAAELALGLSRNDWRELQGALNALGYPAGPEDGLPGRWTRTALKAWQQANGSEPSGYLMGLQQLRLLEAMALKTGAAARAQQP